MEEKKLEDQNLMEKAVSEENTVAPIVAPKEELHPAVQKSEERIAEAIKEEGEPNQGEMPDKPVEAKPLSDKAVSLHVKIVPTHEFPKDGIVLTIENAYPTKPYQGEVPKTARNDPTQKYFQKKLVIEFAEEVEGIKFREYIPSVFYDLSFNPRIPKACADGKLQDNLTSTISKIRNMLLATFPETCPANQSDAGFVDALIGKKVMVVRNNSEYEGKTLSTLAITEFVKEE